MNMDWSKHWDCGINLYVNICYKWIFAMCAVVFERTLYGGKKHTKYCKKSHFLQYVYPIWHLIIALCRFECIRSFFLALLYATMWALNNNNSSTIRLILKREPEQLSAHLQPSNSNFLTVCSQCDSLFWLYIEVRYFCLVFTWHPKGSKFNRKRLSKDSKTVKILISLTWFFGVYFCKSGANPLGTKTVPKFNNSSVCTYIIKSNHFSIKIFKSGNYQKTQTWLWSD